MKRLHLALIFGSVLVASAFAKEKPMIHYISWTNHLGQVQKVAIVGQKLASVRVTVGTNDVPYTVTSTNTVKKCAK